MIKMGKKRMSVSLGSAIILLGGIMAIAGLLLPGEFVITTAPLIGPMYEVRFEQVRNAWLLIAGVIILIGLWYSYKGR